jgi:hypothetical protein
MLEFDLSKLAGRPEHILELPLEGEELLPVDGLKPF